MAGKGQEKVVARLTYRMSPLPPRMIPLDSDRTDEGAHLKRNLAGSGDELEELGSVSLVETPEGAPEPGDRPV